MATAIIPINMVVFMSSSGSEILWALFMLLALIQLVTGLAAAASAAGYQRGEGSARGAQADAVMLGIWGALVGLAAPPGIYVASLFRSPWGAAWGRPLRLRGRILHPELRVGSDWTRGRRPDVEGLDAPTRAALEALWLHDAQKEHASVPAFARISWQLAAVGAPAELLEGAHRAALEEIDHARRCFALAAGYGDRSHSVEPMPDLLVGGLDLRAAPLETMAIESLKDGCLLEDFNADVAAACAEACEDPAVKDVLARIAREERSHADFSWQLLQWLLGRGGERVRLAVEKAIATLPTIVRPTAVSAETGPLVAKASSEQLRAHGRIPDEAWARLWRARLEATRHRARSMTSQANRAAA